MRRNKILLLNSIHHSLVIAIAKPDPGIGHLPRCTTFIRPDTAGKNQ
jgi:hypothetical protein